MGLKRWIRKAGTVVAAPVVAPARAVKAGVDIVKMKVAMSIARHVLTALGGFFVTNGALSGEELETGIGAVLAIAGVVASVIEKRRAAKALAVAKASPAEV